MDEKTQRVLLGVAGFLRLLAEGHLPVPDHARKEAAEHLNKIGELLAEPREPAS